jgi:hypothetical protein
MSGWIRDFRLLPRCWWDCPLLGYYAASNGDTDLCVSSLVETISGYTGVCSSSLLVNLYCTFILSKLHISHTVPLVTVLLPSANNWHRTTAKRLPNSTCVQSNIWSVKGLFPFYDRGSFLLLLLEGWWLMVIRLRWRLAPLAKPSNCQEGDPFIPFLQ